MNRKMIGYILGRVLIMEAALMVPSVAVGLIYREQAVAWFLPPMLLTALLGWLLSRKRPESTAFYARDGFFIVASAWLLLSLFGALPFYLSGYFASYWDSLFEIVSGFTTTGASILSAVEGLPNCILFWRSFSHWIGGMGVLVFVLAIMPMAEDRSLHLMRAEVPGPVVGKLVPRMRTTAMILYGTYSVMTVILIALLLLGGMPLFDSVCHAFGAAGTGGFAIKNAGIAYYNSAYIDIVLAVGMLLFGVNFNLYYLILIRRFKIAIKSEELWWYVGIVAASTLSVAVSILPQYGTIAQALRYSFFQVSSIITTTGYATADFASAWSPFAQTVLVLLMIVGACAGSPGGGLMVSRVIILVRTFREELQRMMHPRKVGGVRIDGKALDSETVAGVRMYFVVYMLIVFVSILLLSLDGKDFTTNVTAELACFNNIGPGLGQVGPMANYASYSVPAKLLLTLNMLLGRLEIFPILVLFTPSIWRRSGI